MGRAIRYVPYPVVGGFLGATGCLILLGAVRVITGIRLQFATLGQFANLLDAVRSWARLRHGAGAVSDLASLAHAVRIAGHSDRRRDRGACRVLARRRLAGGGAGHGLDLSAAAAASTFMLPWSADELARYPWYALPDLLGNLIAVIFVTASSTLFNTTGIEVACIARPIWSASSTSPAWPTCCPAYSAAIPAASRSAAPSSISTAAAPAGCPA